MTNGQKMGLLLDLFHSLFQAKAANKPHQEVAVTSHGMTIVGRWFKDGTIRGYDFNVVNNGKTLRLRMIEQNPNTCDAAGNLKYYSNLARQGTQIVWLINQDGGFMGRIQDGTWHASKTTATAAYTGQQPYQPAAATAASLPVSASIPDIPASVDIPDFVLHSLANDVSDYEEVE